ncbi:hypothetical protein [Catellatospora sp. NPDC049133]|uniref:hypothetical protein n=1 Tax=Catellatospora sp. NPDC049133 TaxID=3155499 RepID=UPI0033E2B5C0
MTATPSPRAGDQRAVLSLAVIVITIGATIWFSALADDVPLLRDAYQRLQSTGYVLLTALAVATLASAALHPFWARRAGRSVRLGWVNAALVLAYTVLVGLLAWYLGAEVPAQVSSGRGGGTKGSYMAWLIAVLPALAVVAWAGSLFPRLPEDSAAAAALEAEGRVLQPARPRRFYRTVLGTAAVCWAFGVLPFLFLILAVVIA